MSNDAEKDQNDPNKLFIKEFKSDYDDPNKLFIRDFKSDHDDPGLQYIENFHKRKISTITHKDIYDAVMSAAVKGSAEPEVSHLLHVRELLKSSQSLMFKLSKEERHEIFVKASSIDKKIVNPDQESST